jgi:hypothetical protein
MYYVDVDDIEAYDLSNLTGMKHSVLKSNVIYLHIIFANHVKSTNFTIFLYKLNKMRKHLVGP